MVLWIIGMSGSGKTVIGKEVYNRLKEKHDNIVFLDGDIFRAIMGGDLGFTVEERKKNALRICGMCKFLDSQKIHVICSVLSIFHDSQEWNRENLRQYREVYIKVSMETLIKRDSKSIYSKATKGELKNVVGMDIDFLPPKKPDIIIENEGTLSVSSAADTIIKVLPKFV